MTEIKKPTRKEIVAELWRRGRLEYKMHSVQREMFEIYESADKNATLVWLTSRQVGKCLEENTLVSTPQGSVKIKDIQVGSIVYGYNSLGEVSPTEVTGVHKQGKKEVIELLNRGRVVAIATKDHRWLAWDSYTKQEVEVTTEKLIGYPRYKIRRECLNGDKQNNKKRYLGVVKGRTLFSETYDISVNNDTHLYCLANGLITHNSTMLCLLATMTCIKKSNSIVKIVTDTKVHAQMILEPKFIEILEDCPEDLKPTYIPSKYMYQFPNGSQIQMAGTDGNSAERLRGAKSELVLVDEAAFCTNLEKVVLSILRPTTTHTGGKIILASSAPEDPDHDFTKFMERAELEGNLTSKTIYDNPLLTTEQVRNIINGYVNGINNPQFRREYLNIIEKNAQTTVFPEVNIDTIKEMTSNIPPMPSHYDCYVGMDLGFKDMTVIAFAHYDFKHNVLVFDGEIAKKGPEVNLKELPNEILAMEAKLYTDPITGETRTPSKRVSDIMPLVTQEIARNSGYQVVFKNADKQDRLTAINAFRTAFSEGRIKIHAGACPTIVRHLINCRWKSIDDKSDFARSPDDSHYDAAAAAYYLFRSVVWEKNPFPHGYRDPNRHYNTLEQSNESVKSRLSKIFKR
jgi:hypothetical protein